MFIRPIYYLFIFPDVFILDIYLYIVYPQIFLVGQ